MKNLKPASATNMMLTANILFAIEVSYRMMAWKPSTDFIIDHSRTATTVLFWNIGAFYQYSLISFLFSTFIVISLKLAAINRSTLLARLCMCVAGGGFFCGQVYRMLAMTNAAQIQYGTVSCGTTHTLAAFVPLSPLISAVIPFCTAYRLYAG